MESLDLFILTTALGVAVYLYGKKNFNFFKKNNFPFVPSPLPFIGNLGPFVFKKLTLPELVQDMYNRFQDFKYFGLFQFNSPVVMIRDPEMIKMITVKDFDHFVDRSVPISRDVDTLFGLNLSALEGQRWKDMRATLSPAFTSSKMKGMFVLVSESGDQLANHLQKLCKESQDGVAELELKDLFTRYANDVIATSAFGVRSDSLKDPNNEFYLSGIEGTNFTGKRAFIFMGFRIWPALMKMCGLSVIAHRTKKFFSSLVLDTMEVREREGIIRPDMIHLLMEAKKGTLKHEGTDDADETSTVHKTSKSIELSDDDIIAQAFVFFVAGFDTASTHLCFLTNLLATHPDVQRRLQEEIDAAVQTAGGKLTYDALQSMKYLDMCVSEALRLWPPAAISNRQCVRPYTLPSTPNSPSFSVGVGDEVWVPIYALHRDPHYFPHPDRYDPERFSDENKHNIQPYTYMPFGTGPRACIGMRFALMEVKVAIISILTHFDLEVTEKTSTSLRLSRASFTMGVEGGFWVGFKPRKPEHLSE